jgi:LuxR family transcriptional regulator, maltose regulon positive regulatory protein
VTGPTAHDALAATKFIAPRVPSGWVPRPRLVDLVERGLEGPLTLLAASPGAGKSALLGAWAAERSGPLGWLSLDPLDRDRRRFWRGVLEALARGGAPEPVASLAVPPTASVDPVVPELVNALEHLDEPLVLVLDDLHEIGDGGAIADLDRLFRHPPPALRVVAATRVDPPLRLGRMRIAGALTDIRERDLAFTEAETAALLHAAGIELAPAEVGLLWQRTEGWAAGLRLAALTLRTHPDPSRFVAAFAGDDAAMADYLLAEVLAQQPDDLVDFLLRTSIVDPVSAGLADALTGRTDSEHVLMRLEREHALVTALGDDHRWHRYHPLLRELLCSQLRYRLPAELGPLHERAARWYADAGRPAEALRHAADAGDWETVAALAGEHWVPLLVRGELSTLHTVLESLPRNRSRRDPEVALALSATLLDVGDEPAAGDLFDRAIARRDAVPAARRTRFDLGVAAIGLLRARLRGDLEEAIAHAQAMIGEETAAARADAGAREVRALALVNLGIAELWTGALDDARRDLEGARRSAEGGDHDWLLLLAIAHLAAHAALATRLERARRLAEEAIMLATRRGWGRSWPVGLAEGVLSEVALERNRRPEAEVHLARAEELLAHATDVPLRMAVRLQRARLLAAAGRPEPALETLEGAAELAGGWPVLPALRGLMSSLQALSQAALGRADAAAAALAVDGPGATATAEDGAALARLRLLEGDSSAALAAVAPWLDGAPAAFGATRSELWLLDALARDAAADVEGASASLERALDEAEPHGLRRPFVELGGPAAALLRRQLRRGTSHRSLVEDLLRDLGRPQPASPPRTLLLEPLSEREAAVLRFLPTMMSNGEIAAELFVSVNTVKTHLKSIYRKLDVPDRREAVRRARDLELLAP